MRQIAYNPLQTLQHQTNGNPAIIAGALARSALLVEVDLTPKPGLVDAENNGSHPDLSRELFYLSAEALEPYFIQYWQIGADKPLPAIFPALRSLGLEAEAEMFAATGGRNTHKGVHFCLGLVLAAAGYLYYQTDWQVKRTSDKEQAVEKERLGAKRQIDEKKYPDDDGQMLKATAKAQEYPALITEKQLPKNSAAESQLRHLELAAELLSFVPRICGDLIAADLSDLRPISGYAYAESFRRYGTMGIRAEVSSGFLHHKIRSAHAESLCLLTADIQCYQHGAAVRPQAGPRLSHDPDYQGRRYHFNQAGRLSRTSVCPISRHRLSALSRS